MRIELVLAPHNRALLWIGFTPGSDASRKESARLAVRLRSLCSGEFIMFAEYNAIALSSQRLSEEFFDARVDSLKHIHEARRDASSMEDILATIASDRIVFEELIISYFLMQKARADSIDGSEIPEH